MAGTIRIVTWNVARFIEMKRNNNKGSQTRLKMMELIRQQDADIFCLQEFFHSYDSTWYPNLDYFRTICIILITIIRMILTATSISPAVLFFHGFPLLTAG